MGRGGAGTIGSAVPPIGRAACGTSIGGKALVEKLSLWSVPAAELAIPAGTCCPYGSSLLCSGRGGIGAVVRAGIGTGGRGPELGPVPIVGLIGTVAGLGTAGAAVRGGNVTAT